jgi:hypothetical protein
VPGFRFGVEAGVFSHRARPGVTGISATYSIAGIRAPIFANIETPVRLLLGSRSAAAADEILHFFLGNEAIFIGIHCLEHALVSRLKLLQ